MGWDRRAGSPLKCTLPHHSVHSHWDNVQTEKVVLYQEVVETCPGTIRVKEHNCKDCPKTDGKQRLNGIENRCEA